MCGDQPQAWMVYANDLRAAGERAACISAYKKVIELNPKFAEAYWNLSNLEDIPLVGRGNG